MSDNGNLSQSDLLSHPLLKQVTSDIAESQAQLRTQQLLDGLEVQRARQSIVTNVLERHAEAIDEYEQLRLQLHAAVGKVWTTAQEYSSLTSNPPPSFSERIFNEVNIPSLRPDTRLWSNSNSPFTTTRAAVDGWMATHGKTWPLFK